MGVLMLLLWPLHASATSLSEDDLARELTRVTAGVHSNYERFVLHTTQAVKFEQLETVDHAIRIVLDNVTADDKALAGNQPELSGKFGMVKNISYEQYTDGLLVLIELADDVSPAPQTHIFVLTPDSYGGHRVVVDIAKPGHTVSVAEAAPEAEATPASFTPAPHVDHAPAKAAPQSAIEHHQDPFATQRLADDGGTQTAPPEQEAPNTPKPPAPEQHAALRPSEPTPPAAVSCEQYRTNLTAYGWSYKAAFDLAGCLSSGRRWSEAAQVYEQILQRDPEFHRARLALADIYGRTGQIDLAKQAYLHVLATNPPTDVVKVIQLRMDALNQ